MRTIVTTAGALSLVAALGLASTASVQAAPSGRASMGLGLGELVAFHQQRSAWAAGEFAPRLRQAFSKARLVQIDDADRVLVDLHLDGRASMASVRGALLALGAEVQAEAVDYRRGLISAWLPLDRAERAASTPGVRSMALALPPRTLVGRATSQGVAVLKADQVASQLGLSGKGITVGVMSDSYNTSVKTTVHATQDVLSCDLPGPLNRCGHKDKVEIVDDHLLGTDEGRAMAQIVHDVAPDAKLCFATAYNSQAAFAANMRKLATGNCGAQVIVDDIIYLAEPMFSDGLLAQTIDSLAASGVHYFSSAGNNEALSGYRANYRMVSDAAARAGLSGQNLDLGLIAPARSVGGFHAFDPAGGDISQTLSLPGSNTLILQWDDPFDVGAVSADYDLYVYSADGKTLVASSTDDNFATDEPIEGVAIDAAGTYQVVITRADGGAPGSAARLAYVNFGDTLSGEYLDFNTPTTYGHSVARGASGVGAIAWYEPTLPESFTSPGPVTIAFDAAGTRLAAAETRRKPDFAAPDGGNTTFFPPKGDSDEDTDTLPNFFGTSAAAPHAAAVAALMLEKAGGPGKLSPTKLRSLLRSTASVHDVDANFGSASATAGPMTIKLSGTGSGSNMSSSNPDAFTVSLSGASGYSLQRLKLDLSGANAARVRLGVATPGLQFDPRSDAGYPFTLGTLTGLGATDVSAAPLASAAPFDTALSLSFAPGAFVRGDVLHFGVDRDEVALGAGGNSMDRLAGGTISGVVLTPSLTPLSFSATIVNKLGTGYSPLLGYGPIDALAAVQAVP